MYRKILGKNQKGINKMNIDNKSVDDVQVNIRFNKKDYQLLQNKFKKYIVKCKGKIPSIQSWIREMLLV